MREASEIQWTPEQVSAFWDYQSKRPSAEQNYFSISHGAQIAKRTVGRLSRGGTPSVLDFGCGTGHFLQQLARFRPGIVLQGIDFSAESIARSRKTLETVEPAPRLHLVDGYPTSPPADSFDAIYMIEVVEHLSDAMLDSMVAEACRLLKKDGLLIVTTPNREDLELLHTCCPNCAATFHIWQHVRSWSSTSLGMYMATHELSEMQVTETLLEPGPVRLFFWIARKLGLVKRRAPHLLGIYRK